MSSDPLMSQEEIERLLAGRGDAGASASPAGDAGSAAAGQAAQSAAAAGGSAPPPPRDDLEAILREAVRTPPPAAAAESPSSPAAEAGMAQHDVDYLLTQAERAIQSVNFADSDGLPAGAAAYPLPELTAATPATETATLDLIRDVELDLKIELGRTYMYLEDVLKLRKGSVVPLDKLAGDPVDICVNGRLVARGEVLVLNDNFCVRVAELVVATSAVA